MSLINIENVKKEVEKYYNKQNILNKTIITPTVSDDILKTLPSVHIAPQYISDTNTYPHVQKHQRISHEILYNDHVFRNTSSKLGLGYFSIR